MRLNFNIFLLLQLYQPAVYVNSGMTKFFFCTALSIHLYQNVDKLLFLLFASSPLAYKPTKYRERQKNQSKCCYCYVCLLSQKDLPNEIKINDDTINTIDENWRSISCSLLVLFIFHFSTFFFVIFSTVNELHSRQIESNDD